MSPQLSDSTDLINDEMIRLHDAASLLRSLPPAVVPTSVVEVTTNLIRTSTATAE